MLFVLLLLFICIYNFYGFLNSLTYFSENDINLIIDMNNQEKHYILLRLRKTYVG